MAVFTQVAHYLGKDELSNKYELPGALSTLVNPNQIWATSKTLPTEGKEDESRYLPFQGLSPQRQQHYKSIAHLEKLATVNFHAILDILKFPRVGCINPLFKETEKWHQESS